MKIKRITAVFETQNSKATDQGLILVGPMDEKDQLDPKRQSFGLLRIAEDEGEPVIAYPFFSLLSGKALILDFGECFAETKSKESPVNPTGLRYYQLDWPKEGIKAGVSLVLRAEEERLSYKVVTLEEV